MKLTKEIVDLLIEGSIMQGGCTIDIEAKAPLLKNKGYIVGIKEVLKFPHVDVDDLEDKIGRLEGDDVGRYIGSWYDKGFWFIDTVEWVEFLSDALQLGLDNNQKAIWNLASGKEIRLDDEEE